MRKNLANLPLGFVLLVFTVPVGCHRSSGSDTPEKAPLPLATQPAVSIKPDDTTGDHASVLILQEADRPVHFSSLTGVLHGDGLRLDPYDRIVGWKNRTQRVTWRTTLIVPGTYLLECDTAYTGPTREACLRIQVGESQFVEGLAELSEKPGVLATSTLGQVTLDAPRTYNVELEMVGLPLIGEFSLAELRLVPLEAESLPLSKFATEEDSPETP